MPFTVADLRDLVRILEERPEWRADLRRILLAEELLSLPQVVQELAEAQKRTEEQLRSFTKRVDGLTVQVQSLTGQVSSLTERVDGLTVQVQSLTGQVSSLTERVDDLTVRMGILTERVDGLTERVDGLAVQVQSLTEGVNELVNWQRGEAGRREGERYERQMIKDAPYLFNGGDGGATDDPVVRSKLSDWLSPVFETGKTLDPEERPTLADIIWWKGEQVAVVEVSLKVNGEDVMRAFKRARTLQSAGVSAIPVVVGQDWASLEARELAREREVEWIIDSTPSQGLISFRRLPPK